MAAPDIIKDRKTMPEKTLQEMKDWFRDYVTGFYTDDSFVNANLKLKEDHTARVCQEIVWLAGRVGLEPAEQELAEAVALFHDLGRFRQFAQYRTFADAKSINHSELALEIMNEHNLPADFTDEQKEIIRTAIRFHSSMELPGGLDRRTELFAKLIRDADKLDIYYVVIQNYARHKSSPEGFVLEVAEPDNPSYTPRVVQAVMEGRRIDYTTVRTINDVKLLQLGWVFDVNFPETLQRIRERRFLLHLLAMLPRTKEIAEVGKHIFKYVDRRISDSSA